MTAKTELLRNNPDSDEMWQVDLRSDDLTKLDLINVEHYIDFIKAKPKKYVV